MLRDKLEESKDNTHSEEDIDAYEDCLCRLEWDLEIAIRMRSDKTALISRLTRVAAAPRAPATA
jgi:hypothetical protein